MENNSQDHRSIRAVIFDYGEVLCSAPPSNVIASMAALFSVTPEQFRKFYSRQRQAYDRGDLAATEYWSNLAEAAGVALLPDQIEQLRRADVEMWSNVDQDVLRWVRELRAKGVRTAVLSNMHGDMVQFAKQNFTWLAEFDCLTLSSDLHMVKPDAEIYRHCLQCLGVAPEETLFLDDREANIRGAQALGIQGIVVQSPAQLRSDLQVIGMDPLPY